MTDMIKVHKDLNELLESKVTPALLFICQVGSNIQGVQIDSPDEMPAVKKWLEDAGQWEAIRPLGLYSHVQVEQQSGAVTGTEQPKRRGRPPRADVVSNESAGVVAGGVDPGPLEEEQT
jgi:hypothetical protein